MSEKLDHGTKHLMRLLLRDRQPDGWTKVSEIIWPIVVAIPEPLRELHRDGDRAKLTSEGETVIAWQ